MATLAGAGLVAVVLILLVTVGPLKSAPNGTTPTPTSPTDSESQSATGGLPTTASPLDPSQLPGAVATGLLTPSSAGPGWAQVQPASTDTFIQRICNAALPQTQQDEYRAGTTLSLPSGEFFDEQVAIFASPAQASAAIAENRTAFGSCSSYPNNYPGASGTVDVARNVSVSGGDESAGVELVWTGRPSLDNEYVIARVGRYVVTFIVAFEPPSSIDTAQVQNLLDTAVTKLRNAPQ